jgi:hypothetical protein
MIAQERLPALRRRFSPACHILGDAGLPNVDAKLEQLAMNARCTPQGVGNAHLSDQPSNLSRHRWPALMALRFPSPVTTEPCAVPPEHGVGLDYGERLAGLRTQGTEPSENYPIDGNKWHPTAPTPSENNDLLS